MKTSRIASGALAVALAFGAAACDADGTTASDDVDSVEDVDSDPLDSGTTPDDGLGETTTDTGTTGTDG